MRMDHFMNIVVRDVLPTYNGEEDVPLSFFSGDWDNTVAGLKQELNHRLLGERVERLNDFFTMDLTFAQLQSHLTEVVLEGAEPIDIYNDQDDIE